MGKALIKFVDCIHSLDCYNNESTYEYFIHNYLNELLRTDENYYKGTSIKPMLETIFDKYFDIMLEPPKNTEQQKIPHQAQSRDDKEQAEEIIHKLRHVEEQSLKALTGMFTKLQLCHENSAKLAGHLAELGQLLQPNQFMFVI